MAKSGGGNTRKTSGGGGGGSCPFIGKSSDGTGLMATPEMEEGLSHYGGDETEPSAGEGQLNAHARAPGGREDYSGNRTEAPFDKSPFFPGGKSGQLGRGGSGTPPLGGRAVPVGRGMRRGSY